MDTNGDLNAVGVLLASYITIYLTTSLGSRPSPLLASVNCARAGLTEGLG